MRSMKDAGLQEVQRLRKRALRAHAMGRIGKVDCEYIRLRLDQIEVKIIEMQEDDPREREF